MKAKYYILISLIGLIIASILFANYLLKIKESKTLGEIEKEEVSPSDSEKPSD
jgi:hypothetical protein